MNLLLTTPIYLSTSMEGETLSETGEHPWSENIDGSWGAVPFFAKTGFADATRQL